MRISLGVVVLLNLICAQAVVAHRSTPTDSIGLKTVKGKKFILYKVEQGQTWYGIGHRFGLAVKDIQAANEDVKSKSLSQGQILLIPVGITITSTGGMTEANGKPIYYKVKKKDTLYSIAVKSEQTEKDIRKWNDLKSDNLQPGQKLIVGYEAMKKGKVKPVPEKRDTLIHAEGNNKKEEVKKNLPDTVKAATVTKQDNNEQWKDNATNGKVMEEHGLASFIEDQDINPSKYYALHRTAPKGTIIKVTNIMNKKQVYVKVVGTLPDTGDNNDVIIKISKATAVKLNVLDSRFQVVLNYFGE